MAPFVARVRHLPRHAPRRRPGSRAWSRPTSATGSRPTSTARSREFLDAPTRELVLEVLADTGHADFAVREVRAAIGGGPGAVRAGCRCGPGGWSARRSRRPSGWRPSGTRWRCCIVGGTGDLGALAALLKRITSAAHRPACRPHRPAPADRDEADGCGPAAKQPAGGRTQLTAKPTRRSSASAISTYAMRVARDDHAAALLVDQGEHAARRPSARPGRPPRPRRGSACSPARSRAASAARRS